MAAYLGRLVEARPGASGFSECMESGLGYGRGVRVFQPNVVCYRMRIPASPAPTGGVSCSPPLAARSGDVGIEGLLSLTLLEFPHGIVNSSGLEQAPVRALLDDATRLHDQDPIRIHDR